MGLTGVIHTAGGWLQFGFVLVVLSRGGQGSLSGGDQAGEAVSVSVPPARPAGPQPLHLRDGQGMSPLLLRQGMGSLVTKHMSIAGAGWCGGEEVPLRTKRSWV